MKNLNFVRGLFLMAIALTFGLGSLKYNIGQLSRAGPGLFPLMVSSAIFLIGLLSVVRSYFVPPEPMNYNVRTIAIVIVALCGFALLSEYVNMIVGIVFLVFCSSLAGKAYSWVLCTKITLGLLAIAFAFQRLLGLNLPLI